MKEELLKILKNPKDMLIAVDLDGTLSEGEFWGEGRPKPIQDMIDYVNALYLKGAHIVIYTARDASHFEKTNAWLIEHGVRFHGINMQRKPGADVYIDDKTLRPDELIIKK